MITRFISVVVIVLVLAGTFWMWSAGSPDPTIENAFGPLEDAATSAPGTETLATEPPVIAEEATAGPAPLDDAQPTARIPVPSPLYGSVLTADGSPVAGAVVTWTCLRSAFLDGGVGWDLQDWPAIQAASLEALSDAEGEFDLARTLPEFDENPSVIWVTAPGYAAQAVEFEGEEGGPNSAGEIVLEAAAPIRVRVVDGEGIPVAGAIVEQLVPIPTGWAPSAHKPQSERVFRRQWTTDEEGRVQGIRFPKRVLFRARHAGSASAPWIGSPRDEVLLTLAPTFTATGHVTVSPQLNLTGPLRVRCFVQNGGQEWPLATVRVGPGSNWGPVTLPLEQADGYRFRLERNKVQVVEALIPPPQPGENVEISLAAEPGHELWFLVVDQAGEALFDARITARWDADGVPTTAERHARESDGYVWFGNLPPGTVDFLAECPGYEPFYGDPTLVPELEPVTHVMAPSPASRVTGRVQTGGNPLEDFAVIAWPAGIWTNSAREETFRGEAGGRFALDDVPVGAISLLATAPGFAPGAVVETESGRDEEVVLNVEPLLRGRGRIVDARSGEPIEGALLQLFSMHHHRAVAPCGPPRTVRPDGSFDLVGFAAGNSRVRVTASGYSTRWIQTFASPDECIEFGLVAMTGRSPLTIELVWDGDFDPTTYVFSAKGAEPLPRTYFPADGVLHIEDVSAGIYHFRVEKEEAGPDDQHFMTTICEPDADWHFRFPVAGERSLTIEVLPEAGVEVPAGLMVAAVMTLDGGESLETIRRLDGDLRTTFDGVPVGPYSLRVTSDSGDLAIRAGQIDPDDREALVRVQLGGDAQTIRVVDGEGNPLPGSWVGLMGDDHGAHGQGGFTDAAGELGLVLPRGRYVGATTNPDAGRRYDIPVQIEGRSDEVIELTLDAKQHVSVRLLDGVDPAEGLPCRLFDLSGRNTMPLSTSSVLGIAHWDKFAEGEYLLRVNDPGYWPVEVQVAARFDEGATLVPVYRLGDLRVRVFSTSASALTGTQLELSPTFLSAPVRAWVAEARVESSTGSMRPDPSGILLLRGLPSGTYDWSIGPASGRVTVPAGDVGELRVELP